MRTGWRWWFHSRRLSIVIAIAAIGPVLVAVASGLPLPTMTSSGIRTLVPLGLVAGLATTTSFARMMVTASDLEQVAVRPVRRAEDLAIVAIVSLSGAAMMLVGPNAGTTGFAAARNLLGFLGLFLIGLRVAGSMGSALLPVAYFLGAAMFGFAEGSARFWAFPVEQRPEQSWPVVLMVLLVGILTRVSSSRGDQCPH